MFHYFIIAALFDVVLVMLHYLMLHYFDVDVIWILNYLMFKYLILHFLLLHCIKVVLCDAALSEVPTKEIL